MHAALTMRKCITEILMSMILPSEKKKKIDTSYVCKRLPYDARVHFLFKREHHHYHKLICFLTTLI